MADLAATFLFYLRFANLLVAAYLLWFIYSLYRSHARSFSRTIKLMLVTMLLFFITETVQVFELIPAATFGLLQSVFAFFFLLLLRRASSSTSSPPFPSPASSASSSSSLLLSPSAPEALKSDSVQVPCSTRNAPQAPPCEWIGERHPAGQISSTKGSPGAERVAGATATRR